jgi:hypothetical protein
MNSDEQAALKRVLAEYSVDRDISRYLETGRGLNWESFCTYDELESGIIFQGATQLPDNTRDAILIGVEHWCEALTEIRRVLNDAEWYVSVDDHKIQWNEAEQRYDP